MANILVVDDEAATRFFYKHTLKQAGYSVSETIDGVDAMEFLRSTDMLPEAVILDHRMPNKDGIETLAEMQKSFPAVKVIFISGDETAKEEAFALGATEFLEKPITKEKIVSTLTSVLAGK